jgi:tetratricopeptide (TPR) repeat protein
VTATLYYYLAANARARGNDAQAEDFAARQAAAAPYARVFPNRLADEEVIEEQLRHHPQDAHALYLMGNFLFAHDRYEEGARCWQQAAAQGFEYSVLMRNLGLYSWRIKNDLPAAAGYYEKAVKLAPEDYRLYTDLDEIYFRLGKTSQREKLLAAAPADVLSRDTVIVRQALLLTGNQQYDRALALFTNHNFKPWEGGVLVRQTVALANLQKGREALKANHPDVAETAFRQALEYPENLGSGKPDQPHDEEARFWLGEALTAQNKAAAAREAWSEAVKEGKTDESPLGSLYQGLALRRLGQNDASAKALGMLLQVKVGGRHDASVLYAAGLMDLYDHQDSAAANELTAALDADPGLWQARLMLAEMKH